MTEVSSWPQPHRFGDSFPRAIESASISRAPVMPHPMRNPGFNPDSYYAPPLMARPQLGARSPSVSSTTSSSTSYSAPYSAASNHHGSLSRTLSPASVISHPSPGTDIFAKDHYQGLGHEHSHTPQPHLAPPMSSPPQYLPAQVGPSLPLYQQMPSPRQFSRSTSYDCQLGSLPPQPPPVSFHQSYPPMYPSYATTPYHSSPALPSYQTPLVYRGPMMSQPEKPEKPLLIRMLERLPAEIISEIHRNFTWLECWQIYRTCQLFRDNFHPDKLPIDTRRAGVLSVEQNYKSYDKSANSPTKSRKPADNKGPPWFGCYFCCRLKGMENFEMYKWNLMPKESDSPSGPSTPIKSEYTSSPPPPTRSTLPTGNPHYDPSLTRSSLMAAQAANNHNNGRRSTARHDDPNPRTSSSSSSNGGRSEADRVKDTWGLRRHCAECGLKHGIYKPLDVVDLHRPARPVPQGEPTPPTGFWICLCNRAFWGSEIDCPECKQIKPLSTPTTRGRRR